MGITDETSKFRHLLKQNGYKHVRNNGSHSIYKNADGDEISISKVLNKMVARRLIKEHNLKRGL